MLSTGFAVNFSPIPRIAPPPSGTVTDRAGSVVEWLPASAVVMASALLSPRGAVSIRRNLVWDAWVMDSEPLPPWPANWRTCAAANSGMCELTCAVGASIPLSLLSA